MRMHEVEQELAAQGRDGPRRSKTMVWVEPGIFKRVDPRSGKVLPKFWIHYPGKDGKTEREPTHTTSLVKARRLRAKRMEEHGRGEPGRAAEKVRVADLLDALRVDYEVNDRASLLSSDLSKALNPDFGRQPSVPGERKRRDTRRIANTGSDRLHAVPQRALFTRHCHCRFLDV